MNPKITQLVDEFEQAARKAADAVEWGNSREAEKACKEAKAKLIAAITEEGEKQRARMWDDS